MFESRRISTGRVWRFEPAQRTFFEWSDPSAHGLIFLLTFLHQGKRVRRALGVKPLLITLGYFADNHLKQIYELRTFLLILCIIKNYFVLLQTKQDIEEGTTVPSFVTITHCMISKDSVYQIVEQYIADKNYYLVDVKVTTDNRISVEIDSFDGVTIEFCMEVNRHIESQIDREIEDYELEVSSAGLTEPFKVLKQYEKNIGNDVEILTKAGKKTSGILVEVNETEFILEIEKTEKLEGAKRKITVTENITFSYEDIKTTKYIIRFK